MRFRLCCSVEEGVWSEAELGTLVSGTTHMPVKSLAVMMSWSKTVRRRMPPPSTDIWSLGMGLN